MEQRQSPAEHPAGLGAPPGRPGELLPAAARDGDLAAGQGLRPPHHGHTARRMRGHSLSQHRQVTGGHVKKAAKTKGSDSESFLLLWKRFGVSFTYGQHSVVSQVYFTFTIHRCQYRHH